jgi:hypothetical protein
VEQSDVLNVMQFAMDYWGHRRKGIKLKFLECEEMVTLALHFHSEMNG